MRSSPGRSVHRSRRERDHGLAAGWTIAPMHRDDWSAADAVAVHVLHEHGGVAKLTSFLEAGLSAYQVAAMLRRGVLERPRSGWYVDPALPWQAKHAIRVGGLLSCVSACESFGLPVPPRRGRRVHVLLPNNAPRVRHNRDRRRYVVPGEDLEVVRHWSTQEGTRRGWRTDLVETLVDLIGCVSDDWWVAAVDAALHRPRGGEPIMSDDELRLLREALPPAVRDLLMLVDPSAESCLETLLRLAMDRRGIRRVVPQFVPHPAHRGDFLVGDRLIVEADGAEFHDAEADRIRDAFLATLGYTVLRFTYTEIIEDIEGCLDRIEAALAALSVS